MAARRCPRCDAALHGRITIHPLCVLVRARLLVGGALLVLLILVASATLVAQVIH